MIDREIEQLYLDEDEVPESTEFLITYFEELWRRYYHYLLDNPDKTLYHYRYRTSPRYSRELQKRLNEKWANTLDVFNQLAVRLELTSNLTQRVLWCFLVDTTSSFAYRVITGGCAHTAKSEREAARFIMRGLASLVENDS